MQKKAVFRIYRENGSIMLPSEMEFYRKLLPDNLHDDLPDTSDSDTLKLYYEYSSDDGVDEVVQVLANIDKSLETAVQVIFFQTGNRLRWVNETVISTSISTYYSIGGEFPEAFPVENLSPNVKRQLHLWFIASETRDFVVQIILYFQIIEIYHPDKDLLPNEFHECRHLRNIVAHSGNMSFNSLINYCTNEGLDPEMLNRNNAKNIRILTSKVEVVRNAARRIILQGMNLPV